MADNDHQLISSTFNQMIFLLAAHVGYWEAEESDEAGEALREYVESLARENPPEAVAHLIGFLSIALGKEYMIHCLDHFTEAMGRRN